MHEKVKAGLERAQTKLFKFFKVLGEYAQKYLWGEKKIYLIPFIKVAAILLLLTALIKYLSTGTIILFVCIFSGLWVYFTRSHEIPTTGENSNLPKNT